MDFNIFKKICSVIIKVLLPFAVALLAILILVGTIVPKIFPLPPPKPWSTIIILVAFILVTTVAVLLVTWALRNEFYLKPIEQNLGSLDNAIVRLNGLAPKLGILRDRTSLHLLPSKTKWVIGAKLDYPAARINTILDSIEHERVSLMAFLCIDLIDTDLPRNIRILKETIEARYGNNQDLLKKIVSRIYIREIHPDAINLPMDLYDPYVLGETKISIYFPHSQEFLGTKYDSGFLIADSESHERGPSSYFIAKAEWHWQHSKRTDWSTYKEELEIDEDWGEVVPGIQDLNEAQRIQLIGLYESSMVEILTSTTGFSNIAVEKFVQNERHKKYITTTNMRL